MGGQITRNTYYDSMNGPFPSTTHRCHHKPKHCLPFQPCGLSSFPLLFHPSTKGSQILMDLSQRTVKRQGSFCNAITFSNRPIAVYEQVRLKITKKQCCWSGALRLGFTSKDPSRINPDSLPKYACPDLVSQSGFWAKALPEDLCNEGTVISFWTDKKGRVFYRVNHSSPMLFFSGVHMSQPLWALIDVYGLTRGVTLLVCLCDMHGRSESPIAVLLCASCATLSCDVLFHALLCHCPIGPFNLISGGAVDSEKRAIWRGVGLCPALKCHYLGCRGPWVLMALGVEQGGVCRASQEARQHRDDVS
ncbi:hypothetical protein WMY93_018213 [Mugilogobius chulae]|uniref:NHR domain-containing protein n=1 Tax=Mugilogobius chulae TaxID=88201 RepID=A0AAW0NMG3_9GOBI